MTVTPQAKTLLLTTSQIVTLTSTQVAALTTAQKAAVADNVLRLAAGAAAHDMLLWGARGMGKSSLVKAIHAAPPLLDYLQALIAATRSGQWFAEGLSPRAGIAILRAARARALLAQRDYVAPDDIQAILPQTAAHRLVPVGSAGRGRAEQVRAMVEAVGLP